MKYLCVLSLLLVSCASHHKLSDADVKEYVSYQFNCPEDKIELRKIDHKSYQATGCGDEGEFKVMCSLGPCYTIKK
jgi:hypothetical protein